MVQEIVEMAVFNVVGCFLGWIVEGWCGFLKKDDGFLVYVMIFRVVMF